MNKSDFPKRFSEKLGDGVKAAYVIDSDSGIFSLSYRLTRGDSQGPSDSYRSAVSSIGMAKSSVRHNAISAYKKWKRSEFLDFNQKSSD
ncbi:MAG: hypothetical protein JW716_01225 [Candidatus Aenigmarchaeota archaeon]|nr:hypothetical protein [Candidatus Aenigmarchaeota archaeon]